MNTQTQQTWRRISDAPRGYSLWTRDDENGKPIYQCAMEAPKPTEGGYYNAESAVKVKGFPAPSPINPPPVIIDYRKNPPPITPLEFEESDFPKAEKLATELGYEQTAYTSTSALWGLFCLPENPAHANGRPTRGGCIIKTKQFGLMFVQDTEDITGEVETVETYER